ESQALVAAVLVQFQRAMVLGARPGWLAIHPLAEGLDSKVNPAFYARRQQHQVFEASTAMELPAPGVAAGLAAFQGDTHWYFLGVRRQGDGAEVFLEKKAGGDVEVVAHQAIAGAQRLTLHVDGNQGAYGFGFDAGDGKGVQWLVRDADGTILSTDVAGGFVGATLGPFARDEREQVGHEARDEREQVGHEAR
ncbi:MAG: hypothetical protein J7521_23595, partial [Caulobacter sp.]|nr:hypothetical protein [Caulobacter sp.]